MGLLVSLSLLLAACGGGTIPGFTISFNATGLTVQQRPRGTLQLALPLVDRSGNPASGITLSSTHISVTGSGQVRTTSEGLPKATNLNLTVSAPGRGGSRGGSGSGAGTTWTSCTSQGNALFGVAYGNGLFVAVGEGGTILTSRDGVSWTQQTSPTSDWLRGATYGNGLFIAVGNGGTILTSP
jgi:hypothetical protein